MECEIWFLTVKKASKFTFSDNKLLDKICSTKQWIKRAVKNVMWWEGLRFAFVTYRCEEIASPVFSSNAMKACRDSGFTDPSVLILGARLRLAFTFTPRPLFPQGKNPVFPPGAQSRRFFGSTVLSLVPVTTQLSDSSSNTFTLSVFTLWRRVEVEGLLKP